METPKKHWFPAKRFGWGWGPPNCWQGWVVLVVWFGVVLAGTPLIAKGPGYFVAYSVALTVVLIIICWIKGEKPHWRGWEDED